MIALVGTKDYVEERGFFIHDCPVCGQPRVFSVADTRRKLTIYLIPTVPVRSQQVMECLTCHGRWAVPEGSQRQLAAVLVPHDEVSRQMLHLERHRAAILGGGAALQANGRTLYQTLQVDPAADPEVIEAAYKRLALKHHPDRSNDANAPTRMRELNDARAILLDPPRRRAYDASLGIPERIDGLRADDV